MKILIQDKSNRRFLSKTGNWEAQSDNSWEFDNPSEAIKYCVVAKTWNVDLVLRFRQLGEAVDFPLEDASFAVAQMPITAMAPRWQDPSAEYSVRA